MKVTDKFKHVSEHLAKWIEDNDYKNREQTCYFNYIDDHELETHACFTVEVDGDIAEKHLYLRNMSDGSISIKELFTNYRIGDTLEGVYEYYSKGGLLGIAVRSGVSSVTFCIFDTRTWTVKFTDKLFGDLSPGVLLLNLQGFLLTSETIGKHKLKSAMLGESVMVF